ncbi:hypothetical protein Tco_0462310, partial [Tanacetum coccineum]
MDQSDHCGTLVRSSLRQLLVLTTRDGTLISVRDKLKDMLNNLEMGYTSVMPRKRWSNLDKKRSRIMVKDIDRPNGDALRKCILEGPYTPSTITIPVVPATDDSPEVPERTAVETILNMSPENKEHYQSEKEAIHLLLTEIGDEIYSTVFACKTAHDMWIATERIQQGESLNIQDVKTNLFWE